MDGCYYFEDGAQFDKDDPDFAGSQPQQRSDSLICDHCGSSSTESACSIDQSTNMSCVLQSTNDSYNGSSCHKDCHGQYLKRNDMGENIEKPFDSQWSSDSESDFQADHAEDANPNSKELMTLEDLRMEFNSCYTCGVTWAEDHVSLDCRECGGYSSWRPCPKCDGQCHAAWQRNIETSHSLGKAQWDGKCDLSTDDHQSKAPVSQYTQQESLIRGFKSLSAS